MGKTVPTYRNQLEMEIRELLPFRRVMKDHERELFDSIIRHARCHASEGSFMAHADPLVPFFLSILIEHERKLASLEHGSQEHVSQDQGSEESNNDESDASKNNNTLKNGDTVEYR